MKRATLIRTIAIIGIVGIILGAILPSLITF